MHERPADLTDADLVAALREHWPLDVASARYAPVGFGGYHWTTSDAAGRRWFVTANRMASPEDMADLRTTMRAALGLARAGLEFVVAPVPSARGEVVIGLGADIGLTVFPFADGVPGHWGEPVSAHDRTTITDMLAALHTASIAAGTGRDLPVRELNPRSRAHLETSLRERGRPWRGGPYAEPARALVAEHAAGLLGALAAFDDLAARVRSPHGGLVVTHGEVHPGNLIRHGAGFRLIDWDTAGLTVPERDLWWIVSDSGAEAARYAELTGREVSQAALALYRLRWDLDDIGLFLADFRASHQRDVDTDHGFAGLADAIKRVSSPEKFS